MLPLKIVVPPFCSTRLTTWLPLTPGSPSGRFITYDRLEVDCPQALGFWYQRGSERALSGPGWISANSEPRPEKQRHAVTVAALGLSHSDDVTRLEMIPKERGSLRRQGARVAIPD